MKFNREYYFCKIIPWTGQKMSWIRFFFFFYSVSFHRHLLYCLLSHIAFLCNTIDFMQTELKKKNNNPQCYQNASSPIYTVLSSSAASGQDDSWAILTGAEGNSSALFWVKWCQGAKTTSSGSLDHRCCGSWAPSSSIRLFHLIIRQVPIHAALKTAAQSRGQFNH